MCDVYFGNNNHLALVKHLASFFEGLEEKKDHAVINFRHVAVSRIDTKHLRSRIVGFLGYIVKCIHNHNILKIKTKLVKKVRKFVKNRK